MAEQDYLFAVWVNRDTCLPDTGANKVRHVVRVIVDPAGPVTVVDEFTDGGTFEHEDCGPASLMSFLHDHGIVAGIKEIEALAGTGLGGTSFPGLQKAAEHFGCKVSFMNIPMAGEVMNPGGFLVSPSGFGAYLAARQGDFDCMVVVAPAVQPVPVPTPTTLDEEAPMLRQFVAKTVPSGGNAVFITNGMLFRHVLSPQDELDVEGTAPWINGDGKPLEMWSNGTPVADPMAFGTPANEHTASILGLPFP